MMLKKTYTIMIEDVQGDWGNFHATDDLLNKMLKNIEENLSDRYTRVTVKGCDNEV